MPWYCVVLLVAGSVLLMVVVLLLIGLAVLIMSKKGESMNKDDCKAVKVHGACCFPECDHSCGYVPEESQKKVKLTFFKDSGKYYTESIIDVPVDMQVYQMVEEIKERRLGGYREFPYVMIDSVDDNDDIYPHLVIRGGCYGN